MIKSGKLLAYLGATILVASSAPLAEAHKGGGRMAWHHGGHHHMHGARHHHDRHRMNANRHEHIDHHRMRSGHDHPGHGHAGRSDEILPRAASERRRADEIMPQRRLR